MSITKQAIILEPGTFASLHTKRVNGIRPMIEIVGDDGAYITYRGLFGGTKIKRTRRSRIAKILNLQNSWT